MSEHGTERGYRQHKRAGEDACEPCKAGRAKNQADYEKRRYLKRGPLSVDAVGTHRRIKALVRMGWRYEDIAAIAFPESKCGKQYMKQVLTRSRVHLSTFEAISIAYEKLSAKRGPSQQNATLALNRGWPPPMAWDRIDDPDCKPEGYYRPSDIKKLANGKA